MSSSRTSAIEPGIDSSIRGVWRCNKISPGCVRWYAESFAEMFRGVAGHAYEQGFDLRLVSVALAERFSTDVLPGHAVWIDNQYKLRRIADKPGQAKYAVFDPVQDPEEMADLAEAQPDRVVRRKSQLETWQKSVIHSLNRDDYQRH